MTTNEISCFYAVKEKRSRTWNAWDITSMVNVGFF